MISIHLPIVWGHINNEASSKWPLFRILTISKNTFVHILKSTPAYIWEHILKSTPAYIWEHILKSTPAYIWEHNFWRDYLLLIECYFYNGNIIDIGCWWKSDSGKKICCLLAANINFIVFVLTRHGLKPTVYHTQASLLTITHPCGSGWQDENKDSHVLVFFCSVIFTKTV